MKTYIQEVLESLESVNENSLLKALNLIKDCSKTQNKIYIVGNGGSAALASHFATDLVKAGIRQNARISALSLVDNSAMTSAISNDLSFEQVYSWQLLQLSNLGDVLIAISSSGNSKNILNAVTSARELGLKIITISGFDGGAISRLGDVAIVTKSVIGNYGPVEDAHSIICHFLARNL